jgi:hypothetical protein
MFSGILLDPYFNIPITQHHNGAFRRGTTAATRQLLRRDEMQCQLQGKD